MSITVVIKNNEDGKILFASESVKALVVGAVSDGAENTPPAVALAGCCTNTADMALAIAHAREAIDDMEKKHVGLKKASKIAYALLADDRAERNKKGGFGK